MKRTLYIDSIEIQKEEQAGRWYVPIHQNSEYIFNLLAECDVSCERVDQINEYYWCFEIKGRKKNVRTFITNFTLAVAGLYNVREYD